MSVFLTRRKLFSAVFVCWTILNSDKSVSVELPTSPVNVTHTARICRAVTPLLPSDRRLVSKRSISPARRMHSSSGDGTDRQTDTRPLHRPCSPSTAMLCDAEICSPSLMPAFYRDWTLRVNVMAACETNLLVTASASSNAIFCKGVQNNWVLLVDYSN